jgi:hypothetical protein
MGVLCPVVQALVGAMLDIGHDLSVRCPVGAQFVGDDPLGWHALFPQQPGQKTFGSLGISPGLHDLIENIAIVADRAPQPMLLAGDTGHHLVEVPDVIPVGLFARQPARIVRTEFLALAVDRFVTDHNPAFEQHFFNQTQAQGIAKIQPDRMSNELWRKAVAFVAYGMVHAQATTPHSL